MDDHVESPRSDVAAREADFHDDWALSTDPATVDVLGTWKGIGCPEVTWIAEHLGNLRGKRILDLGSGLGEASVWFALQGAQVTALDISPRMLEIARRVTSRYEVEIETVVGSATDLGTFDSDTFDIVYGANVLHHVDIAACLGEVHRVLRHGGRAAFWDPVQYNPVINLYRHMAGSMRTDDEHPLRRADLRAMQQRFRHVEVQGFWLTALAIFARFLIVDRIHPSADRYWKLVIERQEKHRRFLSAAHRFDRGLLRVFPPLRWLCWNIAVVCER
jgi:SAM-dependent methyltransferase